MKTGVTLEEEILADLIREGVRRAEKDGDTAKKWTLLNLAADYAATLHKETGSGIRRSFFLLQAGAPL